MDIEPCDSLGIYMYGISAATGKINPNNGRSN